MGKYDQRHRLNPDDPKYYGCYYRKSKKGIITYFVRKYGRWNTVGKDVDGITPAYVKNFRGALTTENVHHVLPTKHKRLPEAEVEVPTVDEAWDNHYVPWAKRSLKPNTYYPKFNRYQRHVEPYIGNTRMSELTVEKLDKLKDKWTEAGIQLPTQQQVWLVISSFVNTMKALEIYDATAALILPKKINAKRRRKRFLGESQIEDLLAEIKKLDKITWYQCCIMTYAGLRTDEVKRLGPMDIDLNEGKIRTENIKSSNNQVKSDWVPIDEILYPILDQMVQELPVRKTGSYFPRRFKYSVWHKACDNLGLNEGIDPKDRVNRLTPYNLRHSFASNLLKSGADIKQVQLLMRHDRLESTMHYLHADDDSKVDAMKLRSKRRKQILTEKHRENLRVIDGGTE